MKWNSFPGLSRGFSAKFQGFSRVRLTMFSKNITIPYRSSACTHPPFILRFIWNFMSVDGKRGCFPHDKWYAVFTPNNLIDPPPCVTGITNATALQGQKLMRGKSASEHNFSWVGCNFKVFQGIFPGANKIQGFSGSSRVSRVSWPPC